MRVWVNGQLLESPREPVIGVLDHGLVVGDGVFETIKVEHNRPFALRRHMDRLGHSARGLGIGEIDIAAVVRGVAATMAGQDLEFGRIRVTVTSGAGPLGSARGHEALTLIVVTESCERPAPTTAVATVRWPRNERGALAGLKTTSYAENALMVEAALALGASEAVMPNTRGQICEGTGSNIVYVVDGRVVTPSLSAGPLAGITRSLLLDWARDEIEIFEEDHPIEVLQAADEVMLVGTTRDVQAISRVDERVLPAPGPLTQSLQRIWARESARAPELWDL